MVINLYISYTLRPWLWNLNSDFPLKNCLFGSVKLTKNADPDRYKNSGYSIGYGFCSEFLFPDGNIGKYVIIFGAKATIAIGNNGKDILILGERPTQGLDDIILTAEAIYLINFTKPNKKFVVKLHHNGINSF